MISNYSLFKVIAGFSRKEINLFEKLIASPFFNSNMHLLKLFREIKKYYPDFTNKKLSKEQLFRIVYPNQPYKDEVIRKNFSRLYSLAEEFLSISELKSQSFQREINIIEQFARRNSVDMLNKKLNESRKNPNSFEKINLHQLYSNFRFQMLKYNYSSDSKSLSGKKHELSKSLENLTAYFLFYLISSYGQIKAERVSFEYHNKREFPEKIVDELHGLFEKIINGDMMDNQSLKMIISLIYYDMLLNNTGNNETAFRYIYNCLIQKGKILSKDLQHYYFKRLIVYIIIEGKSGGVDRSFEALGIYKRMIKKGLFMKNGKKAITFSDFRTILLWSLKHGEVKWAENFVTDYLDYVFDKQKMIPFNYANAYLNFYKRNFSESLKNISSIKTDSFRLKLDIHSLRARNFYEQGYYDSVISALDTFRHIFDEGSIYSNQLKMEYIGFSKLLRKILKQKNSKLRTNLSYLRDEASNYKTAAHYIWLDEKIKELEEINSGSEILSS